MDTKYEFGFEKRNMEKCNWCDYIFEQKWYEFGFIINFQAYELQLSKQNANIVQRILKIMRCSPYTDTEEC